MAIFTIVQQPGNNTERLPGAVEKHFPDDHYALTDDVWLVASSGTAQDICNKLGVTPEGTSGSAVVLEAASYFGRANPAVWSWIRSKWGAGSLG